MEKIKNLLKSLNIESKKYSLYLEALTHNSYQNENRINYNYQRLEFLGDAIISKIVACYLFLLDQDEKEMTENRKILVKTETLQKASDDLDLINYAYLGKGINLKSDTKKMRADLFEALIGAIYIDVGELKVYEILKRTIFNYFTNDMLGDTIDYKTKIQEYFCTVTTDKTTKLSNEDNIVVYKISNDNNNKKIFIASLFFDGICYGIGNGTTIKEAEKNAAKQAYDKFIEIN